MAGLPDVDSLATYGGALSDYDSVDDSTVDEAALYRNRWAANVAGMTQTACRAWCAFVGNAGSPTFPASSIHGAVWGATTAVRPTLARTATGVYTLTWPVTVEDYLGVEHTLKLRRAWVNNEVLAGNFRFCQATVTAANVVTVYVFGSGGAADNGAGYTFCVWVI